MDDVQGVLGISYELMAKTLIIQVKDQLYEVVVPGGKRLDKRKLAVCLGTSKKDIDLLPKEVVESRINVPVGAIPPFGLNLPVVIDQEIASRDLIYCGFGSNNTSLEVKAADLIRVANACVAEIAE